MLIALWSIESDLAVAAFQCASAPLALSAASCRKFDRIAKYMSTSRVCLFRVR